MRRMLNVALLTAGHDSGRKGVDGLGRENGWVISIRALDRRRILREYSSLELQSRELKDVVGGDGIVTKGKRHD